MPNTDPAPEPGAHLTPLQLLLNSIDYHRPEINKGAMPAGLEEAIKRAKAGDLALPKWRHKVRGSVVTEIARGRAQAAMRPIVDMDAVVIYRHGDEWWVREADEFDDGRFEDVT